MFGRPSKAERDLAFAAFMEQATPSLTRTAWLLTGNRDQASEPYKPRWSRRMPRGPVCVKIRPWPMPGGC